MIDPQVVDAIIMRGLEEDVGSGDVTTLATVPADVRAEGHFLVKESGVIAGTEIAARVFARLDDSMEVRWDVRDGERVFTNATAGRVLGPARAILTGERLALNILQRMSGIATATRRLVEAARPATILDTRKTAPGLRHLDKLAVRLGGGQNHRTGLYDRFLIKDNHIAAAGGIPAAIRAARAFREQHAPDLLIEVEARTLPEVDQIIEVGGVDWILLDNLVEVYDEGRIDVSRLHTAVQRIGGRLVTEASGNVTIDTVAPIAATGVDYISSGALTHSVRALDVSLNVTLV